MLPGRRKTERSPGGLGQSTTRSLGGLRVELVAAGGLWLVAPTDPWTIAGAVLIAIIWVSTALIQIPCHNRLTSGFHQPSHRRLVDSNWIRTIAWTLRGAVAVVMATLWF